MTDKAQTTEPIVERLAEIGLTPGPPGSLEALQLECYVLRNTLVQMTMHAERLKAEVERLAALLAQQGIAVEPQPRESIH